MSIKEACMATGLTRKAIRYYESVGLISPDIDSNGYRNSSGSDPAFCILYGIPT